MHSESLRTSAIIAISQRLLPEILYIWEGKCKCQPFWKVPFSLQNMQSDRAHIDLEANLTVISQVYSEATLQRNATCYKRCASDTQDNEMCYVCSLNCSCTEHLLLKLPVSFITLILLGDFYVSPYELLFQIDLFPINFVENVKENKA